MSHGNSIDRIFIMLWVGTMSLSESAIWSDSYETYSGHLNRSCLRAGFNVTVRADGFRAGCGKVKITPESPVRLAGYESRNRPSEGVAADLYARALAINDGKSWTVLVAADVIDFDPVGCREIKTEARRRFGIREELILLVGSHTHSGPEVSSWGTSTRKDFDKERKREAYFRLLKPRIVELSAPPSKTRPQHRSELPAARQRSELTGVSRGPMAHGGSGRTRTDRLIRTCP